jgi:RNA polymerase sigma-70 factor (ECF subfamily)
MTREELAQAFTKAHPVLRFVAAAHAAGVDPDDVCQDAFLVAAKQLHRLRPDADVQSWLCGIVRNVARNSRRSEVRRTNRNRTAGIRQDRPQERHSLSGHFAPDSGDFPSALCSAVDDLGPIQRCCFLLRAVQGLTYEQIASAMDIPAATARSHVYRARQILMADPRLAEHEQTEGPR